MGKYDFLWIVICRSIVNSQNATHVSEMEEVKEEPEKQTNLHLCSYSLTAVGNLK